MARVRSEIDASTGDLRRLAGWPDLSPLYELGSLAFERWLVRQVSAGICDRDRDAPTEQQAAGGTRPIAP